MKSGTSPRDDGSKRSAPDIALVTGASSGLGKQSADVLAQHGFRVFGTSRSATVEAGSGIEMLPMDVRSDASVEACVKHVLKTAGRIDVLVNNAGTLTVGLAEETPLEDARALFETNFFGVVRVTNAVLPAMRAQQNGRIINISSLAGLIGVPGEAFYTASKFALEGYTEALAHELVPLGVRVCLIEPGFHRTNLHQTATQTHRHITAYDAYRDSLLQVIEKGIREGGDPKDVAEVVLSAAISRTPRLRYRVGGDARWVPRLKAFLPEQLFLYGFRRRLGL